MEKLGRALQFGLMLAATTASMAQSGLITAPVHCDTPNAPSCGDDISAVEAAASYQRLRTYCDDSSVAGHHQAHCETLEAATDVNICDEAAVTGLYYYWAPAQKMLNGQAALNALLTRASTGVAFSTNRIIIEESGSTDAERHYALCSIKKVKDTVGPPGGCTTVAVITPDASWLRGGNIHRDFCFASAEFRNTGAIDISFDIATDRAPETLSNQILKTLQSDLGLTAEERSLDQEHKFLSITSASGLRNSSILGGGWREAMDFDVSIGQQGTANVAVRGTAHISVCRQAVGSLTEYQGLDDAQKTMYATRLDSTISKAVKASCVSFNQKDARSIDCH